MSLFQTVSQRTDYPYLISLHQKFTPPYPVQDDLRVYSYKGSPSHSQNNFSLVPKFLFLCKRILWGLKSFSCTLEDDHEQERRKV